MIGDRGTGGELMMFLLGAAVGAAVVALTTSRSGPELRASLGSAGRKLREEGMEAAEEAASRALPESDREGPQEA
jgi:gas vesicle protein